MKPAGKPRRREWLYSLALVVAIPLLITGATVWLTSSIKSDFDQELRRKADLANQVFGASVTSTLATTAPEQAPERVQALIDKARLQAPDIEQLSVSLPDEAGYRVVASSDPAKPGQPDSSLQTRLAWSKNQSIASLIAAGEAQTRQWQVATPLQAADGSLVAVSVMRVSLAASDALINATLQRAMLGLGVMLAIIIALLLHHFRFVQYAELFRQQRELAQMKDDFISVATHELKAPLSVIKGYISMALEEKPAPVIKQYLATGLEQTDRLGRLVKDLLDVSRLEQGRTKYNLVPVTLPDIISPLVETFTPRAKTKGLALDYRPNAQLPPVLADPDRVSEIVTNLIDNAIKYSVSGTIAISHQVLSEGPVRVLTTTVADTGIGLTPEEQARLFQRFYRARNADTAAIAGTGLGLWIIQEYAKAMGGHIGVQSQKGQGSQFTVTLPLAPDTQPAAVTPPPR